MPKYRDLDEDELGRIIRGDHPEFKPDDTQTIKLSNIKIASEINLPHTGFNLIIEDSKFTTLNCDLIYKSLHFYRCKFEKFHYSGECDMLLFNSAAQESHFSGLANMIILDDCSIEFLRMSELSCKRFNCDYGVISDISISGKLIGKYDYLGVHSKTINLHDNVD